MDVLCTLYVYMYYLIPSLKDFTSIIHPRFIFKHHENQIEQNQPENRDSTERPGKPDRPTILCTPPPAWRGALSERERGRVVAAAGWAGLARVAAVLCMRAR